MTNQSPSISLPISLSLLFRAYSHAGRRLLLRTVILIVSPSSPKWIAEAKETLSYRREMRYVSKTILSASLSR